MTMHCNVSNIWKEPTPYVNVSNTWKEVQNIYVNASNVWKEVYSSGPDWANVTIGTMLEGGVFTGIINGNAIIMAVRTDSSDDTNNWQGAIDEVIRMGTYTEYSDWVLPTLQESLFVAGSFDILKTKLGGAMGGNTINYWTSTQSSSNAYSVHYPTGTTTLLNKTEITAYRAIRRLVV